MKYVHFQKRVWSPSTLYPKTKVTTLANWFTKFPSPARKPSFLKDFDALDLTRNGISFERLVEPQVEAILLNTAASLSMKLTLTKFEQKNQHSNQCASDTTAYIDHQKLSVKCFNAYGALIMVQACSHRHIDDGQFTSFGWGLSSFSYFLSPFMHRPLSLSSSNSFSLSLPSSITSAVV